MPGCGRKTENYSYIPLTIIPLKTLFRDNSVLTILTKVHCTYPSISKAFDLEIDGTTNFPTQYETFKLRPWSLALIDFLIANITYAQHGLHGFFDLLSMDRGPTVYIYLPVSDSLASFFCNYLCKTAKDTQVAKAIYYNIHIWSQITNRVVQIFERVEWTLHA